MTLDIIQAALEKNIALAAWAADNEERGEKVAKFRRYMDGEHDAQMTSDMKKMMRISETTEISPFNSNQCDDVIQTQNDRLTVERIEGDNDAASQWGATLLDDNRFDGLQMDVHEAALRDGDTYVLVEYDNVDNQVYFCHEPAWDNTCGMLVVYKASNSQELACAIKVWTETEKVFGDTLRVNYYYPNRIEKYIQSSGQNRLLPYEDPDYPGWPLPWTMDGSAGGEPIGVPVIPFRNRAMGTGNYGLSELENVLPLQDTKNRIMHSMIMTAELSAFPILVAKGFTPSAKVTPGMIVPILSEGGGPLSKEQQADFYKIEGSGLEQFITVMRYLEQQIEAVSRTPSMQSNANMSGEAMKQSEIKLLGKVRRFQVKTGNSWEDVMAMAHRLQTAAGTQLPPASKTWRTQWEDAQLRNDKDWVDMVLKAKGDLGAKETLRQMAEVFGLDDVAIERILGEVQQEQAQRTQQMLSGFNPFPTRQVTNGTAPAG